MGEARNVASVASDHSEEQQKGGYSGSTEEQRAFQFATLMDICHLKNAELEPKCQKYKGWVVLRGDIVKKRFRLVCCVHRAGFVCVTNDGRKRNGWPGEPRGMSMTGGGGPSRVPNVRVCQHSRGRGGSTQGGKGE